jgi:ribonuclease E
MAKKILVDGIYPDETRIAIVENGRLEDFDYNTASKKTIKGCIYLAKVTRVEPSLQAAFIDYGNDKHGFISFAEIHPDYYNIPIQDKQQILEQVKMNNNVIIEDVVNDSSSSNAEFTKDEEISSEELEARNRYEEDESTFVKDEAEIPSVDENYLERVKKQYIEKYKIQEVIKRNQILLVQAIKEERGNKGASFTTYISLAGRYCVIMPNSNSLGGISRKIANSEDRRRLKVVVDEINNNNSISVIIRTIGQSRKKEEILQDYDYLVKLWESIKEKTFSSNAPAFIHAEDDIIKRIIRDLYDDKTDEILIQGKDMFNSACKISSIMVASDDVKIREYKEKVPIFSRFRIDEQIANLYNQIVYLESGGYIVINHTEALIAIDINSGKATSERNIEETATKTNIEAAREIARQVKLRNLSGLIVIDFIDMVEARNRRSVERTMKDMFYNDKAKIQISHISSFGLMEMSRQRMKPSFLESNTVICTHCNGKGVTRSSEANALMILRTIENEVCKTRSQKLNIYAHPESIMYLLNYKRANIVEIESKYNIFLIFHQDVQISVDSFAIEDVSQNKAINKLHKPYSTKSDVSTEEIIISNDELSFDKSQSKITGNLENKTQNRRRSRPRKRFKKPTINSDAEVPPSVIKPVGD